MSIETSFDIPFIAAMALKEKQIQQNYRPIIAVHKWFARRPGTLFRGLILSEFGDRPVAESFFEAHDFTGKLIADPFMGGGTPLLEANRVGCGVLGFDINPMAAWIVREEMEQIDLARYSKSGKALVAELDREIGVGYRTDCVHYGDADVPVKYFLWVKVIDCAKCGVQIDLFPGYLIADNTRHPKNVLVCVDCGEINEVPDVTRPGLCSGCRGKLVVDGPAGRNRCRCGHCGHTNTYPRPEAGPPKHRLFAIEYYNPLRKHDHVGRFFKKPDAMDLARLNDAQSRWQRTRGCFVPEEAILPGDETDRLHRWGYGFYRELFNDRQLLGLELSCRLIMQESDIRVRHALATNLSDLLRYQNMLCRYDTMALKSLDIFSVHGFPVGLIHCESNLLGIINGNGANVGSGGWVNIIEKYTKAKRYCEAPFETRQVKGRKVVVPIEGEWIGETSDSGRSRAVTLRCVSSTELALQPRSLDAVFTDPPYFGNVQYGELMDFCYVWLRSLVAKEAEGFDRPSTRSVDELTGNVTQSRGIEHFTEGLSTVYSAMQRALKPGAPLAFTFHHNRLEAYYAVGVAILDAGLVCPAVLPCPAEMGGSIHIHGTGSSIVDSVFICRNQTPLSSCAPTSRHELCASVVLELDQLKLAGMRPTGGDIRCLVYGHLTRLAITKLHDGWDRSRATGARLARFATAVRDIGDPLAIIENVTEANRFSCEEPQETVGVALAIAI